MAGTLSLRHLNLSSSRLPGHSVSQRVALRQFEQWRATANPYAPASGALTRYLGTASPTRDGDEPPFWYGLEASLF